MTEVLTLGSPRNQQAFAPSGPIQPLLIPIFVMDLFVVKASARTCWQKGEPNGGLHSQENG